MAAASDREVVVSDLETLSVDVNGFSCRVWKKGDGPRLGFLAGFGGLPRWVPFLDALARERTVVVPSLPGFPGGERGHSVLDCHLDWVLAIRHLLQKAGLDGADLAASTVGGSFAAEITRLEKRLPLIEAPTLLIRGAEDRIMPRSYVDRFAAAIAGETRITIIPGAGHLAELDKPDEVAAAILRWTS